MHIIKQSQKAIAIVALSLTAPAKATEVTSDSYERCLLEQFKSADESTTIGGIKNWCKAHVENSEQIANGELSPLQKRIIRERENRDNPNVITSHKRNYMLPVTYIDNPDTQPVNGLVDEAPLDNFEAKFQLSFKAPIAESLITDKDMLFFGFTVQSYWQMYNSDVSSPFRETNYQPEVFYGIFNDYQLGEWTNRVNVIGIEHQSNGRTQPLSRSWNRLYAQFVWENDNWLLMFKPWYRIPESEKDDPLQADGDDNPDIDKYMGNFEFSGVYQWEQQTFGLMLRNNLRSDNRGAIQLDWTFPMGKRFKGYAQYFNGYGESLIDYNHSVERLVIGVLLTDIF